MSMHLFIELCLYWLGHLVFKTEINLWIELRSLLESIYLISFFSIPMYHKQRIQWWMKSGVDHFMDEVVQKSLLSCSLLLIKKWIQWSERAPVKVNISIPYWRLKVLVFWCHESMKILIFCLGQLICCCHSNNWLSTLEAIKNGLPQPFPVAPFEPWRLHTPTMIVDN